MQTTLGQRSAADTYIRRIRNTSKRAYAREYWYWLVFNDGRPAEAEPKRGNLSYMAAQAVRMDLSSILNRMDVQT